MENNAGMIILKQRGGIPYLTAVIGAKDFLTGTYELQFSLPSSLVKDRGNKFRIEWDKGSDSYTMTLYRIRRLGLKVDVLNEKSGILSMNMIEVFKDMTGLFI